MFGFELIDVFWPVGKVLKSSRKHNPNTYLPGAQNTTWEIYSKEFLRGIPAEQVISETVKGSDSSFAAHTHGLTHTHDVRSGQNTGGYTWAAKGLGVSLAHTHTLAQHNHTGLTSHYHGPQTGQAGNVYNYYGPYTNYTYAGVSAQGVWYTLAGLGDMVSNQVTSSIVSGNSSSVNPVSTETGIEVGVGFETTLGNTAANSTPLMSTGKSGITNNRPAYKEVYQWVRTS